MIQLTTTIHGNRHICHFAFLMKGISLSLSCFCLMSISDISTAISQEPCISYTYLSSMLNDHHQANKACQQEELGHSKSILVLQSVVDKHIIVILINSTQQLLILVQWLKQLGRNNSVLSQCSGLKRHANNQAPWSVPQECLLWACTSLQYSESYQ